MLKSFVSAAVVLGLIASSTAASAACTDGHDRRVEIVNDTTYTITHLFPALAGTDDWDADLVDGYSIEGGEALVFDLDDSSCECSYDLRVRFNDGTEIVRQHFNVCNMGRWRIVE